MAQCRGGRGFGEARACEYDRAIDGRIRTMTATEIWLMRHGETDWNKARRLQGWKDIPLNERGVMQARKLATRLHAHGSEVPFSAIYSSDLERARTTADPAAELLGMRVRLEPGLRERCYGVLEGLAMDELDIAAPLAAAAWRSRDPARKLDGGETLGQFHSRVVAAVDDIAARHAGERVLVFTHGGVLDMVWRRAHGIPLQHARDAALLNAGVNRIAVEGDEWRVLGWGDVDHMAEQASRDDVV
jgi:probable phosphoglycerate mutase